jgi:hypothetical protein
MLARHYSNFKHVARNRVNEHKFGTWDVSCDEEWLICFVAWNCLCIVKCQLTRVREPLNAVKLIFVVENYSIPLAKSLAASIEHFVRVDLILVNCKDFFWVYLLNGKLALRWRQLSFYKFKAQNEWYITHLNIIWISVYYWRVVLSCFEIIVRKSDTFSHLLLDNIIALILLCKAIKNRPNQFFFHSFELACVNLNSLWL